MSYTFGTELDGAPTYEELLEALPPGVRCIDVELEELAGSMEEGIYGVYVWGVSTRAVEVAWERGRFSVRILACSCEEDYRMALECVAAIARPRGAEIASEEGTSFAADAWEAHYGDEWIRSHVRSMVDTLLTFERDATGAMMGPTREFALGPRTRRAIEAEAKSTGDRQSALFARMRQLFYPPGDRYYAASAMRITPQDGEHFTATAWMPEIGYLFPKVDYLLVRVGDDMLQVPFDTLEELAGRERVRWIDEDRPLVEPIEEAERATFGERCRARASQSLPSRSAANELGSTAERPSWGCLLLALGSAAVAIVALAYAC